MHGTERQRAWRSRLQTWSRRLAGAASLRNILYALLVLLLLDWAVSGVRVIREDEQGVVLRFGKVVRVLPSGMRFTLPWPIERTIAVKTTEVRTMPIGYRLVDAVRGIPPTPKEVEWVSGDTNIFNLTLTMKYAVSDPVDYLFRIGPVEADFLVRRATEAELTQLVATMTIDEILTHGKTRIQQEIRVLAQQALDELDAGIRIVTVNIGEVVPPANVIEAFNDVSTAKLEKARMINDADGYAKDLIPRARAMADRMIQEAEIYRAETVNRAQGATARYLDLLEEYQLAQEITEVRLYLEAMERILPRARKVVVEDREGNQLRLLE
ncbi:MAG: FtsH protease activity modulator HflK [Candidatus Eisenbacteria bacterium]|nr:FtsH protease activity modulator HflK [Candidatus Eisenbacteria bacterium]